MLRKILMLLLLISFSTLSAQELFPPGNNFKNFKSAALENTEKSPATVKYVALSLLLPGAGEWFLGKRNTAKVFFGSEFLVWAGLLGTQGYINVLENDFQTFAARHAGVNTAGKDDQFWIDIGNGSDIYVFNETRRLERNLDTTYPESEQNYWQWDDDENSKKYNSIRFRQHTWKQRLNIFFGGLILNRLVSAVDVVRLISKSKKSETAQTSQIYFDYLNNSLNRDVYRLNFKIQF